MSKRTSESEIEAGCGSKVQVVDNQEDDDVRVSSKLLTDQ